MQCREEDVKRNGDGTMCVWVMNSKANHHRRLILGSPLSSTANNRRYTAHPRRLRSGFEGLHKILHGRMLSGKLQTGVAAERKTPSFWSVHPPFEISPETKCRRTKSKLLGQAKFFNGKRLNNHRIIVETSLSVFHHTCLPS